MTSTPLQDSGIRTLGQSSVELQWRHKREEGQGRTGEGVRDEKIELTADTHIPFQRNTPFAVDIHTVDIEIEARGEIEAEGCDTILYLDLRYERELRMRIL